MFSNTVTKVSFICHYKYVILFHNQPLAEHQVIIQRENNFVKGDTGIIFLTRYFARAVENNMKQCTASLYGMESTTIF